MMRRLSTLIIGLVIALGLWGGAANAAGRSAWTAGNGVGLTWTTGINGSDLANGAGLNSGSTVLSSVADIANGTALDIYADLDVRLTVASATPSAGAYIGIYLVPLLDDGATYGDGSLTSGGVMTRQYPFPLACTIPLQTVAATTLLAGYCQGIIIPPGSFRWAFYNASGMSLSGTAGNNIVKYRTYNLNLNN